MKIKTRRKIVSNVIRLYILSIFDGFFFSSFSLVPPSIDNLECEDEIEKESVISKGSSGETFTSFTAMSRRTKGSAKGSVVGKIDEGTYQYNCCFSPQGAEKELVLHYDHKRDLQFPSSKSSSVKSQREHEYLCVSFN